VIDDPIVAVRVDSDLCAGHGRCYSTEPELFAAEADGYALARVAGGDPNDAPGLERAAVLCPESAIILVRRSASS
jgi:ferredoxin